MKTFLTLGVLVAALAAVPFLGSAYLTSFLFTVLIAYILAQSWDWVAGEMGYVNLGHYCFYGLGAYAFSIALMGKYPAAVAILVAVLLTVAVAAVLAYPLFRLRGDYFAFATLALLPLAELLAYNMEWLTKGGDGIVLPIENVVSQTYLIALVVCVVTFIVTIRINAIRFGYALKGIRNDEDVAEVLGVRIAPV
ncbi:MAG: branched-chain amino acid ABC transporter permease, partial [Lacisediminimonas sp.]|nr:branched-chain amino acid ABC transporter permease [Lacisediminimonas sp.]